MGPFKNVYIVHHVGNSTQLPMIGLLGLTDPKTALQNFRAERGNDVTSPVPVLSAVGHRSSRISGGAICGIAAGGGVIFGAVLTVVISACLSKRAHKY